MQIELAESIQVTPAEMYQILVTQATISATTVLSTLAVLACVVITWTLLFIAKNRRPSVCWPVNNRSAQGDFIICTLVVNAAFWLIFIFLTPPTVTKLLNPEHWALRQLL